MQSVNLERDKGRDKKKLWNLPGKDLKHCFRCPGLAKSVFHIIYQTTEIGNLGQYDKFTISKISTECGNTIYNTDNDSGFLFLLKPALERL